MINTNPYFATPGSPIFMDTPEYEGRAYPARLAMPTEELLPAQDCLIRSKIERQCLDFYSR